VSLTRDLGYNTPNSAPTATRCITIAVPDTVEWLSLFMGAIDGMTEEKAWKLVGTVTEAEAAERADVMFRSVRTGNCHMIGEIILGAFFTTPDRYLACDGSSYARVDYPDLYAVLDSAFIVDADNFTVPDLRGMFPRGAATSGDMGMTGGEENHTLTVGETPSHSHSDFGHTHSEGIAVPAVGAAIVGVPIPSAVPAIGITGLGFASLSSAGGDGAHNNLPPYQYLAYFIVALP